MYILGAIKRQADEEIVVLEETAPLLAEQDTVCLQGVLNALTIGIFQL